MENQEKKNIITSERVRKYEEELNNLKEVQRHEIAQKIKEAREQGDLSENAEYDAAKDEQRDIEARIAQLEELLKNVEVIDETTVDTETVSIGCTVKIRDMETKEDLEYRIDAPTEANPLKGIISYESPVGAALIGKKVKETAVVETPAGELKFKILEISNPNKKDDEKKSKSKK